MTEFSPVYSAPVTYAGFWRRLAARILDGILLSIAFGLISLVCLGSFKSYSNNIAFQFLSFAATLAFEGVFLHSLWQATPGKRLMHVYVEDAATSTPISMLRAVMRYMAILGIASVGCLLMVALNPAPEPMTAAEQQEINHITERQKQGHKLDDWETQYVVTMNPMFNKESLSPDEFKRWTQNRAELAQHHVLNSEEFGFMTLLTFKHPKAFLVCALLIEAVSGIYILIASLMIGINREKAGPHDRLCHTRVLYGRV